MTDDPQVNDMLADLDDPFASEVVEEDEEASNVILTDAPLFTIPRGKYAGLVLPRMVGIKPTYYDKVVALKDEIAADPEFQKHIGTIAQTYAALRREAAEKAAELSEIKLRMTAVMLLMVNQFDSTDTSGVTLKNGDKVRVEHAPHLVVTDKEQFRLWCISEGLERSMTLPWGTANKLTKEMLMKGLPEPPGTQTYERPKVVFTPAAKEK